MRREFTADCVARIEHAYTDFKKRVSERCRHWPLPDLTKADRERITQASRDLLDGVLKIAATLDQ